MIIISNHDAYLNILIIHHYILDLSLKTHHLMRNLRSIRVQIRVWRATA